jgi:hypothetical protein
MRKISTPAHPIRQRAAAKPVDDVFSAAVL